MSNIWKEYGTSYPTLRENIKCGVAVVGGGMTGVILAYLLSKSGFDVALFEGGTIGSGKTARSTAKVTLAHGFKYADISENFSPDVSRKYAAANLEALRFFREHLGEREKTDMYLYSLYGERRLMREYNAMTENGISCQLLGSGAVPLPFKTEGAIKIPDQYAIDPVRFCLSLCKSNSFRVFENSPAEVVDENLLVCNGHKINADYVALCTNYPLRTPMFASPLKLSRKTSLAVKLHSDSGFPFPKDAMAYGADGGYGYRYGSDPCELIVSGETSRGAPSTAAEERLIRAVQRFVPTATVVESWSNNDTYTHDGLPYGGRLASGIWVACGYSAWGMTTSAAMAQVIAGGISGRETWYGDIFSPKRNFLKAGADEFARHMKTAASGVLKQMTSSPDTFPGQVCRGQADIVTVHGKRAGAYCDESGKVHLVSLKCPHLGCSLEWNSADKTWDCPCHGSRFSYTGECISNPADTGIRIE